MLNFKKEYKNVLFHRHTENDLDFLKLNCESNSV